tara:strand:- start:5141 stop:5818 length:678 start_codon:yes stop_codon:yes gene_type:complete
MGKRYLDTKKDSLESSILNVWQEAAVKQEKLSAKQKKLDVDGDGEIEGSDLAKLRKKGAKKEGLESSPNKANSQHLCAKNVVHEEWGEGQPVHGMHSEPDEEGNIAWYDVMFEHGIEKGVSIDDLVVTKEGHHGNHKKKTKEEVKESFELGTDDYREHTQEVTPGQQIEKFGQFKVQSMREAMYKVWGLDEKKLDKEDKDVVKGNKAMTGGKVAKVDMKPEIEES